MNLEDQQKHIREFFNAALGVVANRQSDYAPDGIVLLNALATAVRWKMTIFQVLGVLLDKQTTALARYCRQRKLDSDTPESRLRDAANYFAFFGLYLNLHNRAEIHAAWWQYWNAQPCVCTEPDKTKGERCERCQTLSWLRKHAQ